MDTAEMGALIAAHGITSPDGNELTPPRESNILFETATGTRWNRSMSPSISHWANSRPISGPAVPAAAAR